MYVIGDAFGLDPERFIKSARFRVFLIISWPAADQLLVIASLATSWPVTSIGLVAPQLLPGT